ncbi:hypothetical protein FKW77_002668 [Venturia effusa]|uniref:Uncharacterized protein n=1 Tax=Venturia effusa TaxID=50376 RepID=A0A517L0Y9_9PEZI|nr:hypothetical protein FKW77_002668 [Venturia effusa]
MKSRRPDYLPSTLTPSDFYNLETQSLPRELRHQILRLVFEPAITADLDFNSALQKYVRSYYGNARLEALSSVLPAYLSHALGPPPEDQDDRPTQFAPSISRTGTILLTTFPDIADDVCFMLSASLDQFERGDCERQDRIAGWLKSRRSAPLKVFNDVGTATETWSYEAEIHDQLADRGAANCAVYLDGMSEWQVEKFGIAGILRFNRVVLSYRRWREWEAVLQTEVDGMFGK